MKLSTRNLTISLLCSLSSSLAFAQSPQGINYQAVARDLSNNPIPGSSISVRFAIYKTGPADTVWAETHSKTTNAIGLFTAVIGQGTSTGTGSAPAFNLVDWGTGPYFLHVKVDGNDMGSTQFWAVPYAMFADSAAKSPGALPAGTNEQTLRHNGSGWVPSNVIRNDGVSVGIGTASVTPAIKLEVNSAGQEVAMFEGSNGSLSRVAISASSATAEAQLGFIRAGGLKGGIRFTNTNNLDLFVNGVPRFTATPSGNIGIANVNPDASALFDMVSTNRGLLIPRMTGGQRTAIGAPATGLMVYQTDFPTGFHYYDGSVWLKLSTGAAANDWSLNGNIIAAGDYIGTNNGQSLVFKVNSVERARIATDGKFVLGQVVSPTADLSLEANVDKTIKVERASGGAGKTLTIEAGGAAFGASNTTGGLLKLSSGIATGNNGSIISFLTASPGGSGSSDQAPTEKMRLTPNGQLGIGTATVAPGAALELAGKIKIVDGTQGASKVLVSDANGLASWQAQAASMGGSGTANRIPKFNTGTTLTNSQLFDDGTFVGLNELTPQAKLHISSGGTTAQLQLGHTNQPGNEWQFVADASANMTLFNEGGGTPFTSMHWKSNGTVGIGMNSTTRTLAIKGDNAFEIFDGIGSRRLSIDVTSADAKIFSANGAGLSLGTGGAEKMRIAPSGDVGVGISNPGRKLQVTFTSSATGIGAGEEMVIHNNQTTANNRAGIGFAHSITTSGAISAGISAIFTDHNTLSRDADLVFLTTENNVYNQKMIIKNSGDVGIGQLVPAAKLHVDQSVGAGGAPAAHFVNSNSANPFPVLSTSVAVGGSALSAQFIGGDVGLGDGTVNNNQAVVVWLQNNSVAAMVPGEIVIVDPSASMGILTTATPNHISAAGIVLENIAIGAAGRVAIAGVADAKTGPAVAAGEHVVTSAVPGAAGSTATPAAGTSIGIWLETAGASGTAKILLR